MLDGTIDDPDWSKWTVAGDSNKATKRGTVEFATDDPLTTDRLGTIPFIPATCGSTSFPTGGAVSPKLTMGGDRKATDRSACRSPKGCTNSTHLNPGRCPAMLSHHFGVKARRTTHLGVAAPAPHPGGVCTVPIGSLSHIRGDAALVDRKDF
jgi:hypothetical protein